MRLINLIVMLVSLTVIAAYAFEIGRVLRGQRRFSLGFAVCAVIFPLFFGAIVVAAYQAKPIRGGFMGFSARRRPDLVWVATQIVYPSRRRWRSNPARQRLSLRH